MKVLCLIENLGSGGAERQMVGLAALLKERGHDVTVLTYYPDDFYKHVLDEALGLVNDHGEVSTG